VAACRANHDGNTAHVSGKVLSGTLTNATLKGHRKRSIVGNAKLTGLTGEETGLFTTTVCRFANANIGDAEADFRDAHHTLVGTNSEGRKVADGKIKTTLLFENPVEGIDMRSDELVQGSRIGVVIAGELAAESLLGELPQLTVAGLMQ
jgi:hypothetical protein